MKRSALPTIDRWLESVVANGVVCDECLRAFVEPHGKQVTCRGCFGSLPKEERTTRVRAWLEVAENITDRAHFSAINRRKKAERNRDRQ